MKASRFSAIYLSLAPAMLLMASVGPGAADDIKRCLSLAEVHGDHPRYRVIDGQRCWHASGQSSPRKSADVDVNPYDDPIWRSQDPSTTGSIDDQVKMCEQQALKVDPKEDRYFLRECVSSKM